MHDSLTLFSFFLLIHANNCVWIHGKSQTVAFCDAFLIFKRKNNFERKHEFLKFLTHLDKLNVLQKMYFLDSEESEILSVPLPLILSIIFLYERNLSIIQI